MKQSGEQDESNNGGNAFSNWPARLGGLLVLLGTGLSMMLEGWLGEAAMAGALLGLITVLAAWIRTK